MHFLEICENLGNLRIARELYGDHQKSNEANPMSSDREADAEKEEHTRVTRPRSRCREGSSSRMRSHNKIMQSQCQNELDFFAELRYVGFQRLLVIMRNRFQEGKTHACQETAKPMSRRKSKPNAKPMSRYCEADVNAMLEVLQS